MTIDRQGSTDSTPRFVRILGIAFLSLCMAIPPAYGGDHDEDDDDDNGSESYSEGKDPSGLTRLVIDEDGSALEGLPEANLGFFG